MRRLFHFPTSPFARRVRLALAHKGLTTELCDVRAHPEFLEESRRLSPLKTIPVLVEEDGLDHLRDRCRRRAFMAHHI